MKNYFLLLISFLLPIFLLGNITVQDSLLIKLKEAKNSTQIQILEELAMLPNVSKDQQIIYLNQAIKVAENINNPVAKANTLFLLGDVYLSIENYDQALFVSQQSLTLFNENNKIDESIDVLILIGIIHADLGNMDKAISQFKQVLKIRSEQGDKIEISNALINVGNILAMDGNLDEAMDYYQKALRIKEELDNLYGLSQLYNNIANIHFEKGEMDKVLPYRIKALEMDRASGDEYKIALKTCNLAEYYLTIKEPQNAIPYINESKAIAEKIGNFTLINDNIQFLSLYYELINNNTKALEYQKLYATSIKETFSKELSERVGEMQVKYETEKKDKEAQAFKLKLEENQYQKLILLFLSIIGFLISSFIIFLYLKKKKNNQFLESEVLKRTNELRNKNVELERNSIELRKSKVKAEESDRLKSAFLANMSHEIRTPMNGILGFTGLLLEPELNDETKEAYIRIIHQSGERMLSTVTDIVEISKIEAGIVEVQNSTFSIYESLNNILDFFQPQAQKKGLVLCFDKKIMKKNPNIYSDKGKFESIFTNLIKNAIKYTDKGKIEVNSCINNGFVEFCIKDTGIGVPKHRQRAIFNRFEQADIADTRAFEGSGLGLAIAKSYVEMLGGNIWVESVDGKGSQFYFTIPISSETKETLYCDNKESNDNKEKLLSYIKLLIVEDDETSAIFLKTILKDIVHEIIYAQNGEQAIEQCKTNVDFDIILMDIKMPGIDGFETTKKIRKFNKDVIIIAQTAYAMVGDKEKAISSGCNDYISKPIQKNELLKKIIKNIKKSI